MADAGIDLHMLQRVAGHQDPAATARYVHPDTHAVLAAGSAFSACWCLSGPQAPTAALPAKTSQVERKKVLTCGSRSGPLTVGLTVSG
jgi:hypothetical protein